MIDISSFGKVIHVNTHNFIFKTIYYSIAFDVSQNEYSYCTMSRYTTLIFLELNNLMYDEIL